MPSPRPPRAAAEPPSAPRAGRGRRAQAFVDLARAESVAGHDACAVEWLQAALAAAPGDPQILAALDALLDGDDEEGDEEDGAAADGDDALGDDACDHCRVGVVQPLLDRRLQTHARGCVAREHERGENDGGDAAQTSISSASPWPPPEQIAAQP